MPLRALPPQGSASANFATQAGWPTVWGVLPGEKYSRFPSSLHSSVLGLFPTLAPPLPTLNPPAYPLNTAPSLNPALLQTLEAVAQRLGRMTDVFGAVTVTGAGLEVLAKDSAAPASYRLFVDRGKLWVALMTQDRWLSQSIEQDLVHTGDKMSDLLEEELVDLGFLDLGVGPANLPVEHFRDDAKFFTFRSATPVDPIRPAGNAAEVLVTCLAGYEACFRRLGDMEGGDEEE